MKFPTDIKAKALAASGRRCCICKKGKGKKIEVHHIDTEEGNKFENAIPLCFDCHCEVGHYNDNHPKGNKFSKKELVLHRDHLYKLIEQGKTPLVDEVEGMLNLRYVIFKDCDTVMKVLDFQKDFLQFQNY